MAVDTLGHLLALYVTSGDAQDHARVGALAEAVQTASGEQVAAAYADAGYTGAEPERAAERGIALEVVTLGEVRRGIVLLPRLWAAARPSAG